MNWHDRYVQQAGWTRELRSYLFEKVGLSSARRVLEVGCGTGAILHDILPFPRSATSSRSTPEGVGVFPTLEGPDIAIQSQALFNTSGRDSWLYGLDLAPAELRECHQLIPSALLARGDAHKLPYRNEAFEITYCHFVLLWVRNPIQTLREMKRVTKRSGHVLALAEPDYSARVDMPAELASLGALQSAALQRQGATVDLGAHLTDLFHQAGIQVIEAGALQPYEAHAYTAADQRNEWRVLEADLAGNVPTAEIEKMKRLDAQARQRGDRILYVPTYFAWGQV